MKIEEGEQRMNILFTILYFVALLAIMFGVMILGRKYVFSKVRINKYIPLGISIVLLIIQFLLPIMVPSLTGGAKFAVTTVITVVTVTFFLWFLDIQTTGGPKKAEKKIEIRPKAKPNRVKHLKNNDNK